MKPDEIEQLAMNGWNMPETASLGEICCYWIMRSVWQQYRESRISREGAAAEKRRAVRLLREFGALYEKDIEILEMLISNLRAELSSTGGEEVPDDNGTA